MTRTHLLAIALVAPLIASGCVTTVTHTTTWPDAPPQRWERYGRVESVRETVRELRGDPAGGAVAGAVIGGLLGGAMSHHGNPAGAVFGAVTGAVIGANASQGAPPTRTYDVTIRFDDGAVETFVYADTTPFRPGDQVVQSDQGLFPR